MSFRKDLRTLEVNRVVIHIVPRCEPNESGDADRCTLSETETKLDPRTREYFLSRLKTSLSSIMSREVMFLAAEHTESPIPECVRSYLNDPTACDLVATSQSCARYLYRCQNRVNPAGILAIAGCSIDGLPVLALMKLEPEAGISYRPAEVNGQRTFEMRIEDDLLLTGKGRVFKVGLFRLHNGDPEGLVSDHQMASGDIARFYLQTFLGAKLVVSPDVATKQFDEATRTFINKEIEDGTDRSSVYVHLVSELSRESTTINPREFARSCIPEQLRDSYIEHLLRAGVPEGTFDKDLETARSRARQLHYAFRQGISIVGSESAFRDTFRVQKLCGRTVRAIVEDELKRVGRR